jgi:YVTN family beta-propeller protein
LPNIEIPSSLRGKSFTPTSLELDAKTGKLYTAGLSTGEAAIIDGATGKVESVFALPNARSAIGVAWNPVAQRLLVASQGSDNLLIVDPQTQKVVHDVYVGAGALNVAYEPVSGLAFVSNRVAGTLTAVDADGNIVGNFSGGTLPNHVHEDGKGVMYAINKSRGADDPEGDRITRIVVKKKR